MPPHLLYRRRLLMELPLMWAGLSASRVLQAAVGITGAYEFRVVTGADSDAQRRILQALTRRYGNLPIETDVAPLTARKGSGLYLTVGASALQSLLDAEINGPVVSLFTARQSLSELVGSTPHRRIPQPVTAIFAEVSPAHQMRLIAQLYQRRVTVGALLGPGTSMLEPMLRQAAREYGLDLQIEHAAPDSNFVRSLMRLGTATVLLAVPDNKLYTAEHLRNLLESTYRRGQPVIGFSTAMVQAGTLATAYASVDDTLAQLDDVVSAIASGHLPEAQYPAYWRVAINENVARSLNIPISADVRTLGRFPARKEP